MIVLNGGNWAQSEVDVKKPHKNMSYFKIRLIFKKLLTHLISAQGSRHCLSLTCTKQNV